MYRKTDVRSGCVHSGEVASYSRLHHLIALSAPYKNVFVDKGCKLARRILYLAYVISCYHLCSQSLPLSFYKGGLSFAVHLPLDINSELVPHFLDLCYICSNCTLLKHMNAENYKRIFKSWAISTDFRFIQRCWSPRHKCFALSHDLD